VDVRIKYGKTEAGRFISHLDLSRAWERAFRRAQIPIAYSQGFNPHPKISFGSALAVGVTSSGEYLDVTLKKYIPIEEIKGGLEKYLPKGLEVYTIVEINRNTPSLMAVINRAKYLVKAKLLHDLHQDGLNKIIQDLLRQEQILIERNTKRGLKEKDIRSGILELKGEVLTEREMVLEMVVETGSGGNVRPEEVVTALMDRGLALDPETMKIHREGLYIGSDTGLDSPLSVTT
jgi:radical SAM-linked protein